MRITISDVEFADQAEDVAAMFHVLAERCRQRTPVQGVQWGTVTEVSPPTGVRVAAEAPSETKEGEAEKPKGRGGRPRKDHTKAEVKANTEALASDGPAPTDAPIAKNLATDTASDPDDLSSLLDEAGITEPEPVPAAPPVEPVAEEDDLMSSLFADETTEEAEAADTSVPNRWLDVTGKPLYDALRLVASELGGQKFTALLNSHGVRSHSQLNEDTVREILHQRDVANLVAA